MRTLIRNRLVAASVFRLATLLRGEYSMFSLIGVHRALERDSEEQSAAQIDQRLVVILQYAAGHSPRYRNLLPQAGDVSEVAGLLSALPLLTKAELRDNADGLRSRDTSLRVHAKTTGGSTGQPLTVWKDSGAVANERAASWAAYLSYGLAIGDRCVRFWGTPTTASRRVRSTLADLAMNRATFSAFAFSEQELASYWNDCRRLRPAFYYGYSSMLAAFAEYVIASGLDGTAIGASTIVSTSEVLTDSQRRSMVRAFGCKVRNEYGCGELGPIAYECEQGQLHVAAGSVFLEVLAEDGSSALPGEIGRVVVSDLNNRAMPLLRYVTGDFAQVGHPCTCGRNTRTLARIWGREYDFICDQAGRKFHGEFFLYLFEDLAQRGVAVEQFQVIQRRDLSITIRLKASGPDASALSTTVLSEARRRLPAMEISVDAVRSIERLPSGKSALIVREQS